MSSSVECKTKILKLKIADVKKRRKRERKNRLKTVKNDGNRSVEGEKPSKLEVEKSHTHNTNMQCDARE